jgi:hypothetical protein
MSGDTIECFNCGRANPSWAQVCRSCGVPLQAVSRMASGPRGPIPTDQASLFSIALGVGAIAGAVVIGLVLSGLIPDAPANPDVSPTPEPSVSAQPSASARPSGRAQARQTATPKPEPTLPGRVVFGSGIDPDTDRVVDRTRDFASGDTFAHSVSLDEPFGVSEILEDVIRIGPDGLDVVQDKERLPVDPNARVAGFATAVDALDAWGTGRFILRVYRETGDKVERLAEGRFRIEP